MNNNLFAGIALIFMFFAITSCIPGAREGQNSVMVSGMGAVLS